MITTGETFNKSERLCSRKIIENLFEDGNVFYISMFKVVWKKYPDLFPFPAQIALSVSKRGFKHAVTRNLIKRRLREAYRKNKKPLYDHLSSSDAKIAFIVIFRGNIIPDYQTIENSIKEIIKKLISVTGQRANTGNINC